MKNKHLIEHLLRLSNIIYLYNLHSTERIIKSELEEFRISLEKYIRSLYEILISNNLKEALPVLLIPEAITITEKEKLITLLISSREYIKTHKEGLDEYIINIILSKLSKLIYSLKLT